MIKSIGYLKARLQDKGTWAAIGVGVTGASTMPSPASYIFMAVAVIGTLVPTP